jgi:hypothetical protein
MNITLQTNNYNSQYQYKNNLNNKRKYQSAKISQPSFGAGMPEFPTNSKLLDPLKNMYSKFTSAIGRNYTLKLYTSPMAKFLAKHTENLKGVVDHMQVMGSVIISGMYMRQTLKNKDFDDDRKKTLAINQGLTFAMSTLGSYVIDSSLDNWWEGVTTKYASKKIGDKYLGDKIKNLNKSLIAEAEARHGVSFKKMTKEMKPELYNVLSYLEEYMPDNKLEGYIKGMGILKKLLVFGTIYRFVSPVAVTPIANWIGSKLTNSKETKTATANKQENNIAQDVAKK